MTTRDPFADREPTAPDATTDVLYTQDYGSSGTGGSMGTSGGGSGSQMQDTAQQVGQQAGEVVDQAKQTAGEVAGRVREQATSQLDTRKDQTADTLGSVAQALRQTGDQLNQQDQGAVAQYADQAAQQIERLSTYLRNRNVGDLVGEVERFARRQPAIFLGGAFALGLLGARFLKSSSQQAQMQGQGTGSYGYGGYGGYTGYRRGYTGGYTGGYARGYTGTAGYTGAQPGVELHESRGYDVDYRDAGTLTEQTEGTSGMAGTTGTTGTVRERVWTGTTLEESDANETR